MNKIQKAAIDYATAGIKVFPCNSDKSPAIAHGFKSASCDPHKVEKMFTSAPMIGVPMGEIVCLDIDAKHKPGLVADFEYCCSQLGLNELLTKMPKQLTPNGGGAHFLFCPPKEIRNVRLASNAQRETIIETRGKNGYICVSPSKGYSFERGGILDVPKLTQAEVDSLFEIAGSFSEVEIKKNAGPVAVPWGGKKSSGSKPGDDYNRRADVPALLQKHGWTSITDHHWTRPGKATGISATLGKVASGNFYVFSSNAHPFEAETSYTPFAVYATLEHDGDFSEAGKALAAEGYGESELPEKQSPEFMQAIEELFKNTDTFRQMKEELTEAKEQLKAKKKLNTLELVELRDISKPDKLEARKKMAREMVYILPGIACRGQATSIYAEPNSGKTLIGVYLIRQQSLSGALGDLKIVYCNFDDDFSSANEKAEYLSDCPNVMVLDNQEQTSDEIIQMMLDAVEDGTASELCFVLDTLIRFVSDSDKKTQRVFTSIVQQFIGAQGTVIGFGHVNKHKDANGRSIYGGTSDIRNSFSQSAKIEIKSDLDSKERVIKFYNDKLRGMAQVSTCYSFAHGDGKNWLERVATVRRVDEKEAERMAHQKEATKKFEEDKPIINYIIGELKGGRVQSESDLTQNNLGNPETGSKAKRKDVLRFYRKGNINGYEFWTQRPGLTTGFVYELLDATQPLI